MAVLIGVPLGCQRSVEEPSAPVGRWEFLGELPDGREGVVRVEIVEGPFLRFLGFHAPGVAISREQLAKVKENAEAFWWRTPEMLVQFDGDSFLWKGGDLDGQVLFELESGALRSRRADTLGLLLQPVVEFSPIAFHEFEGNL
jgi:hypothetical protein